MWAILRMLGAKRGHNSHEGGGMCLWVGFERIYGADIVVGGSNTGRGHVQVVVALAVVVVLVLLWW